MKIAFIGGGNMASAIIKSAGIKNLVSNEDIYVAEPFAETRELIATLGVQVVNNASELPVVDCYFLCVKPQNIKAACEDLVKANDDPNKSVISIVAGITTKTLSKLLNGAKLVRTMPNTPLLVNQGCSFAYTSENQDAEVCKITNNVFSTVGKFFWLDEEEKLNAVTALSGSGPAYIFLIIEIMTKTAIELGLDKDDALAATLATINGACELVTQSEKTPSELKKQVTSKGGTTQAALEHLAKFKFDEILAEAIKAANERSIELAKEE